MRFKFKNGKMKITEAVKGSGRVYPHNDILITRHDYGTPVIKASNLEDAYYGMGVMHAYDRMFQMWFVKILAEGRAAEYFGDREDLINADKYFRTLNFKGSPEEEFNDISDNSLAWLDAYTAGVEDFRKTGYRPLEFKLAGVEPEPWNLKDVFALSRIMAYVGLAESQGTAEKVLTDLVCQDEKYFDNLKRLFYPYFAGYDYSWFQGIKLKSHLSENVLFDNSIGGSNNWAVSGNLTESGKPIFCNDPHLEISRLPSIWYEIIIDTPEVWFSGITVPGVPAVPAGFNGKIGWGITFTAADTEDFFIEKCKEGKYLKNGRYHTFNERKEIIKTKKGREIEFTVYENLHGTLEGNPYKEGVYLARKWSGMESILGKTINKFLKLPLSGSVKEGMSITSGIDIPTLNWTFADSKGNIGFQMSGIIPERRKGLSGILPIPGWDTGYDWAGYMNRDKLPNRYNPEQGFIVTANNRLDGKQKGIIQNLPFSSDRADRIADMILSLKPLNYKKMGKIQMDVYSNQVKRVLDFLKSYLKGDDAGDKLLAWDCRFVPESTEASLFEDFYRELMIITGSGIIFPEQLGRKIYEETFFFVLVHQVVEEEWMKKDGIFKNIDWEQAVKEALLRVKRNKKEPWGRKNSITMRHLLFGSTILGVLGFNSGRYPLRGSKSTVHQGTMYRANNMDMSFGPSYRLIANLGNLTGYTVIPGGASGRRFSRYYKREIKNWLTGGYKVITGRK